MSEEIAASPVDSSQVAATPIESPLESTVSERPSNASEAAPGSDRVDEQATFKPESQEVATDAEPEYLLPQFKDRTALEKGYKELQSKHDRMLSGFTGAPEGDYVFTPSDSLKEMGYEASDSEQAKAFDEFARSKNMSQEAYNEARNMVAEIQMQSSNMGSETLQESMYNHVETELAKFGESRAEELVDALNTAMTFPGVDVEGINDLIDSQTSAKGLESLMAIINNSGANNEVSIESSHESITRDSLREELARIDAMPAGFQKQEAQQRWEKNVRSLGPRRTL